MERRQVRRDLASAAAAHRPTLIPLDPRNT